MTPEDRYMLEKYLYWTKEEVECYNAAIGHCIESIKEFSKTNTLANDPFLYYVHLISKIEHLKKNRDQKEETI